MRKNQVKNWLLNESSIKYVEHEDGCLYREDNFSYRIRLTDKRFYIESTLLSSDWAILNSLSYNDVYIRQTDNTMLGPSSFFIFGCKK